MMCILPDQELPQYIPCSFDAVPLVVKFSKDCVPLNCFSSTISCLLSTYQWQKIMAHPNAFPTILLPSMMLICLSRSFWLMSHVTSRCTLNPTKKIVVFFPRSALKCARQCLGPSRKCSLSCHSQKLRCHRLFCVPAKRYQWPILLVTSLQLVRTIPAAPKLALV